MDVDYAGQFVRRVSEKPYTLMRVITATNTETGKRLLKSLKNDEFRYDPLRTIMFYSIRYIIKLDNSKLRFDYKGKVITSNGQLVEEYSAQISHISGDTICIVRCDNSHEHRTDPNKFHMDLEVKFSDQRNAYKRKLDCPKYHPLGNEIIDLWLRSRHPVKQVLLFAERNISKFLPLLIYFPFITKLGWEIGDRLIAKKPKNVPITAYIIRLSDIFYLSNLKKPQQLIEHLEKSSDLARDTLVGKRSLELTLRGVALLPIPLTAFPSARLEVLFWSENPAEIIPAFPLGKVIEDI